jgi:hypothetical protein
VAEWLKAAVLKTASHLVWDGGSNPSPSATAVEGESRVKRWSVRIALALVGGLGSYVGLSVLLFVAATHRASLSQEAHQYPPSARAAS